MNKVQNYLKIGQIINGTHPLSKLSNIFTSPLDHSIGRLGFLYFHLLV